MANVKEREHILSPGCWCRPDVVDYRHQARTEPGAAADKPAAAGAERAFRAWAGSGPTDPADESVFLEGYRRGREEERAAYGEYRENLRRIDEEIRVKNESIGECERLRSELKECRRESAAAFDGVTRLRHENDVLGGKLAAAKRQALIDACQAVCPLCMEDDLSEPNPVGPGMLSFVHVQDYVDPLHRLSPCEAWQIRRLMVE